MTASPRKMPLIYVAGPFRAKPDPKDQWVQWQNVLRSAALALDVWKMGCTCICPHLNTAFFEGSAPAEIWLNGDLEMLRRCDGLLLTPDWHASQGATAEREFACANNIPVFFNTAELGRWLKEQA